ncbi:hypothetical protein RsTz2092_09610 [Deferribacterales bacterium RsTz2092]
MYEEVVADAERDVAVVTTPHCNNTMGRVYSV